MVTQECEGLETLSIALDDTQTTAACGQSKRRDNAERHEESLRKKEDGCHPEAPLLRSKSHLLLILLGRHDPTCTKQAA